MDGVPVNLHSYFWPTAIIGIGLLTVFKRPQLRRWILAGVNLAFLWLLLSQNAFALNWIVVGLVSAFFVARAYKLTRNVLARIEPCPDVPTTINCLIPFYRIVIGPIQPHQSCSRRPEVPTALAIKDVMGAARQIAVGLVKSFVIAYAIHAVLLTGFRSAGGYLVLELAFYLLWIHLGLSGYSDMVLGISRLAGVATPCDSNGCGVTAKRLRRKCGLAFVTIVVLLAVGAGQFGFNDFTDPMLPSSDSGLAAARLLPAETAALGGRLSGALCAYTETPRQQQRPLGIVFGSSSAAYGISQLEGADPDGRRWLNLATEELGFQGLFGGTELFLRSGLNADLAVLSVRPAILASSSDRWSELSADVPPNDRNGAATLEVKPFGRTIDNLFCRARQTLLAGQPFEAVFPPAPRPWSPNPLELPDRCSPRVCRLQLAALSGLGWFDAGRYDTSGKRADDFVKTIRRLRQHGAEVVIVLMPESPTLRSKVPDVAESRFTKVVKVAFPKDPPPIVNLRTRLTEAMFADHLRPNARGKQWMTGQLARILPEVLERLDDERYRANVMLQTPVGVANQFSDVIGQADDRYAIEPLGDNNGDGCPKFAVLIRDPADSSQRMSVHELDTGRLVQQVHIPQRFKAFAIKSVQTDRSDLALLLRCCATRGVEVRLINGSTGAIGRRLELGAACEPLDLEVITTAAGNAVQLVFLGTRDTDGVGQVVVTDLESKKTIYRKELPAAFEPHDLEVLPGRGGSGTSLAIVGENLADDVAQVFIKPIIEGEVERVIQLPPRFEPIDLEVFPDSPWSEFAVLGVEKPSGAVRVSCCDPRSASTLRRIDFCQLDAPRDLKIVASGDGRSQLAVLGQRAGALETRVDVRQSDTGQLVDRLSFGTRFDLHRFTYFDSAADRKFAVLETQASPAQARVHVRQGGSGNFCRSIPVFCGFSPSVLPAWYDENRVQAHTRLRPAKWHRLDKSEFKLAAKAFKDLGAQVFTRHAVWGYEDPWWPSAVPATPDGTPLLAAMRMNDGVFLAPGENVVQEFVNEAHQQGTHLIAYYWHQADSRMATAHPEWVTKDLDGKPVEHRVRGACLDITGEYRHVVLARLLELASMGVGGFYFDSAQFPREGFSDALLQTFVRDTGLRPPASRDDDTFLAWLDFKAKKIEGTLQYWRDSVRQQFPHVVFVISAERADSMIDRTITTRQATIGVPKSEYSKGSDAQNKFLKQNRDFYQPQRDVQCALAWTLLRDASGRPPHIWSAGVPNTDHALGYVAALVTHGAVANMDVHEDNLLAASDAAESTPRAALVAAFELGRKVSPYLARTTPVRFAAIHFSEQARDTLGFRARRAWRELHAPTLGAFGHFLRARYPVGVVNDAQISDVGLAGYKVLFLPAPHVLDASQTAAVERFATAGGLVIANEKGWEWSDPQLRTAALAALRRRLANTESPIHVSGGPQRLHAVAYQTAQALPRLATRRDSAGSIESRSSVVTLEQTSATTSPNRLVVALANDFSWVQLVKRNRPDPDRVINPPAPVVPAGVVVTWRKCFGFPEAREGRKLRAFDAVSGESLPIETSAGEYSVTLPEFARMALVVVVETENDRGITCEADADESVERH